MISIQRTTTGVSANVRSVARDPFVIALLVLMPVVSIQLYAMSVSAVAESGIFTSDMSLKTIGRVAGSVFGAASLAGIFGLFQSLSISTADHRLVVSGYRRLELMAAHSSTVVTAAFGIAIITTVSLDWVVGASVASPAVTVIGLFMTGVIYGLLGVVVGSIIPSELEGSLVVIVLADIGAVLTSGLFTVSDSFSRFFPLSHPHEIVMQAVVEGSMAWGHVLPALGHLGIVALLATTMYAYRLPSGGDRS